MLISGQKGARITLSLLGVETVEEEAPAKYQTTKEHLERTSVSRG
jgi:hypothetical protein